MKQAAYLTMNRDDKKFITSWLPLDNDPEFFVYLGATIDYKDPLDVVQY